MQRLSHLSSSTKPPWGAGQSREAESPRRFLVQLQLPGFRCDYAWESPPQAFWHRDLVSIRSSLSAVPAHASLPCKTTNWIGEPNLHSNNPGERKNRVTSAGWAPLVSGFRDILHCQQPEMVSDAAVQKDAWISW